MGALITNESTGHTKLSKDIFPKELHNHLSIMMQEKFQYL